MPNLGPCYSVQPGVFSSPTVALVVIGTGRYRSMFPRLIRSARQFFLPSCRVTFVAFCDAYPPANLCQAWVRVPSPTWPEPTLYRYRWMLAAGDILTQHEYTFYVDIDAEFVDVVGNEVLGDLTAVQHQGFIGIPPDRLDYERSPKSRACVPAGQGTAYYAGGFQGGRTACFLEAARVMDEAIEDDRLNRLCAKWHDESHWNRYLIDHPPAVVLPPTYCCDEIDRFPGARLLALRKDHDALRKP